jgi:hypothetical protein
MSNESELDNFPTQTDEDLRREVAWVNEQAALESSPLRKHLDHRCANSAPPFDCELFVDDYRAHIDPFMSLLKRVSAQIGE